MTRIIAGFAGSTALAVPKTGTRPTSDRVREALFSALESRDEIRGLRVADLYAGTGALGLEAASRGAAHVTLVEKAPQAARICRENARLVASRAGRATAPAVEVAASAVRTWLLHAAPASLDVVFIDPPYELDSPALDADLEALVPALADDALVVVERRARGGEPRWPAGLELEQSKAYGDTVLWWARRVAPDGAATADPEGQRASGDQA
ncbi:16S rRNA (guanine(966)-N(2))-methyltransferase RsmD [Frondihabitans australicus]|uniref:16S rRNA (Guanine966-N2)-methyltransferase n=1 Tax=Frondihabitans australicus TaxID=386892 RepID=A0A495IDD4_9MICO|nr:16S rRNA (guanine(966)-N(2))-methyltransferase RsmD [Frondihabitans australicus]RKR73650.1 16S rRNA (guanine966-N2)-methyltransferase [Frondihabitans australicus]